MEASALCGHSGTLNFHSLGPKMTSFSSFAPFLEVASHLTFLLGRILHGTALVSPSNLTMPCACPMSCSALNIPRKSIAECCGQQTVVKFSKSLRLSSKMSLSYGLVLPFLLLSTYMPLLSCQEFISLVPEPRGEAQGESGAWTCVCAFLSSPLLLS